MMPGKAIQNHVLHVVPGLHPGGMELAMARVIGRLTGDGMRHSIACLKGDASIADRLPAETDIHCLHSRPNEPQLPSRLGRLIRMIRPTVIHARNWGAWPEVAVGRLLAWPIVPLIFSFHGLGRAGYMPLRRRMASHVLARMTTFLFTVSRQSKRMLVSHWGWPEDKTGVIPNGVDTRRFRPATEVSTPTRRSGSIVIGTVGNLRPVKNQAMLLQACAELTARGIDVELRIAGEGPERPNLLALAESLDFGGRLTLAGRVEDVPNFLRGLDVFVLSSDSEQHPNALNEAMACQIASVSTRVGCAAELLGDGEFGELIAPGDLAGLGAVLERTIADPVRRGELADKGCKHIRGHYSMESMAEAYRDMYERLSSRRRR